MIEILITGNPIAKARARHVRRGKHIATYNPQKADESRIKAEIRKQYSGKPILCAISVYAEFYLPRPKSHYGTGKNAGILKDSAPDYHTSKPDLDNLQKWIYDCMNGIIYQDDKQIIKSLCRKFYSDNPETTILIRKDF